MTVHGGDVWQAVRGAGNPALRNFWILAPTSIRVDCRLAQWNGWHETRPTSDCSLYPDPSARRLRERFKRTTRHPCRGDCRGPRSRGVAGARFCAAYGLSVHCSHSRFQRVPACLYAAGVEFVPFSLDRAQCFRVPVDALCRGIESEKCGGVLLNNPHNPSGSMLRAHEVQRILDATRSAGATLLLDEAFIDYAPHETLVGEAAARPGLIVVRSLTKFYGCPALRVGYAVAHPDTIRRITRCCRHGP